MRKITERGASLGLLEPEQFNDESRPQRHSEVNIPKPVLQETANAESGEPFLRPRQRVPVRRRGGSRFASRFGWKLRWVRTAVALIVLAAFGLTAAVLVEARSLLLHNPRFLLTSTGAIQVNGNRIVNTQQVLAVFTPDIGHSIFRLPLARRQEQLEQIRWVRHAAVMRLWPDRIQVHILERVPIAFVVDGNTVRLVDDQGVLLDLSHPAHQQYSFPVLDGISSSDSLATRAARIGIYQRFIQALDFDGGHISATLSEVDLSDPEDVRAMFSDGAHQPLVHFGDKDFLPRYRAYRQHLAEWLQQYPNLQSVDMRYGRQVVLDTGLVPQPPLTSAPLKDDTPETPSASAVSAPAQQDTVPQATGVAKVKTKSIRKVKAVKHRAAPHKAIHRHKPPQAERGHHVRNPIMHVVTGA